MLKALPLNQVVQGNCLEVLREWPEESVDLAMFSPPYWGLRNYGESTETVWGGDENCKHEWVEETEKWHGGTGAGEKQKTIRGSFHNDAFSSHGFCAKCGAWKGQLGLEPTWQLYVAHMVTVCRELKRVLKQTGSMYIVLGDTYAASRSYQVPQTKWKSAEPSIVTNSRKTNNYQPKCLMGIPWRVAFALIDDGWILRNDVVWHKPNAMPSSVKDRLAQTYEHIFHFVRQRKYYYDLDAIREPHSTSTIKRISQPNVFNQKGGVKQDLLRTRDPSGGNQSRCAGMVKSVAFNLRVKDVKRGKKGVFVEAGKVKQLKASQEEVENYVYTEGFTKHDVAVRHFPTVNREGGLGYTDPLHVKAYHEKGKNPGDTFQTRKKPYIGNNPHRMRLQNEQFLALDPSRPMDLSHPKGKNPGDFWNVCTKPFKGTHFAVYPEAICVNPILSSCPPGETVLDPMCGSGTTCLVAKKLGRNFIGIEINPAYVKIARKRLEAVPERLDSFLEE